MEHLKLTFQAKQRTRLHLFQTYLPSYFAENHEDEWEELQALHSSLGTQSLVHKALSVFAESDIVPFAFFSTLMHNIEGDINTYALDSSRANHVLVKAKKKLKALAAVKHFHDSDNSSLEEMNSSSAEQIVAELEQRAVKRGKTKKGTRKRLRWTPYEDQLLAKMYLKHKDHSLPFVAISAYFEDRSNTDCKDRFKAIARSNMLKELSYEQLSNFILNQN